jgi:hypothetical protein
VTIAAASVCSSKSVALSSGFFPSVATAGRASEFVVTMRDASANEVDCDASALVVWLAGASYAAAEVKADDGGGCRVIFSVLEVNLVLWFMSCMVYFVFILMTCDV